MSLIHWWPLNGDAQDKINNKLLNGSWITNSEGKIGSCYGTDDGAIMTTTVTIPNTFSFAFWVKNNDLTYPKTTAPIQFGAAAISKTVAGWDYAHRANGGSPDGTNYRVTLSDGVNPLLNFYWSRSAGNPMDLLHEWYHVAIVVNYEKQKINLYINGISYGEQNITSSFNGCGGTRKLTIGRVQGWKLDGYMNDLRIYDHALSQAEVKELSKALIVHYTFNDILAEPTVNLITSPHNIKYVSGASDNNINAAGLINVATTTSGTYTLSGEYNIAASDSATGPRITMLVMYEGESNWISLGRAEVIRDGTWRIFTLTGTTDPSKTVAYCGAWIFDYSSPGSARSCYARNLQFELKDYATPYTPNIRESMIVDESGYNHPTILHNNCGLTTDTNSGSFALHTAGMPDRMAHDDCSYLKTDIGTLITPTEFTICFNAKVNQWGVQTSGVLSLNANEPQPTGYLTSTFVQYDGNFRLNDSANDTQAVISSNIVTIGKWHHYAFVWNGSTFIGYKDGVQYGEKPTSAAFTVDPFRYIYLGYDRAGGAGRDADVTWGDFKLYMTALDAQDIENLAKTKAYVTDKGDILCCEFIENQDSAQVTEKSIFKVNEIYEEIDSGYERLEYIQSTGAQYIKTGIFSGQKITSIKAHYYNTTTNNSQILFGMYDGTRYAYYDYREGNSPCRVAWYNNVIHTQIPFEIGERETSLKIFDRKHIYTFNGQEFSGVSEADPIGDTEMYLFGYNNKGNVGYPMRCKLYSFQICVDKNLIRDFIPMRRIADGAVGLYDSIGKQFYTSSTATSFVAGPVMTGNGAYIYETDNISGREIIEI